MTLILAGSPTCLRSTLSSSPVLGSRISVTLRARIKLPSLPQMPTAMPPHSLMSATIALLIEPARTISTISMVAASVTRRPFTKVLLSPTRSSILLICGPPPWTTMGFMPTCFISTTSRATRSPSFGSVMAWPPYFTTKVASLCRRM